MFQMYSVLSMYSMSFSRISEKVCIPTGSLFSGFFSISFLVLGGSSLPLQRYIKKAIFYARSIRKKNDW